MTAFFITPNTDSITLRNCEQLGSGTSVIKGPSFVFRLKASSQPISGMESGLAMSPVRRSPPFDGGLGNANAGAKLGLRTASGLVILKTRKNINLFARSEPRELERRSEGLCA